MERENQALRERLTDLASMLEKSKLDEYMGNNNVIRLMYSDCTLILIFSDN